MKRIIFLVLSFCLLNASESAGERLKNAAANPLTMLEAIEQVEKIDRAECGYAVDFGDMHISAPTKDQMQEFSRRFPRVTKIVFADNQQNLHFGGYPDDKQNPNCGRWRVDNSYSLRLFDLSLCMKVGNFVVEPPVYRAGSSLRKFENITQKFWNEYRKWLDERVKFYQRTPVASSSAESDAADLQPNTRNQISFRKISELEEKVDHTCGPRGPLSWQELREAPERNYVLEGLKKYDLELEEELIRGWIKRHEQLGYKAIMEEVGKRLREQFNVYNNKVDERLSGVEWEYFDKVSVQYKISTLFDILKSPTEHLDDIQDLMNQESSVHEHGRCTILQGMDKIQLKKTKRGDVADLGDIYVTMPNQEEIIALAGRYPQLRKVKCKLLDMFQSEPLCLNYADNEKHNDFGCWRLTKAKSTFVIELLEPKRPVLSSEFYPIEECAAAHERYKTKYKKWLDTRTQLL